jgi:hypothetical protein
VLELLVFRDGRCHVSLGGSDRRKPWSMPIAALWCRYGKYRARPNDAAIIPAALRMTLLLATCLFEFPKVQLTARPFNRSSGRKMRVYRVARPYP